MQFNSLEFLIFLPLVVISYFLTSDRWRWVVLLIASYYFYASWNPYYLALICFSTVVNYIAAIQIDHATSPRQRKNMLLLSLVTSLGLLFIFKYYGFFSDATNSVLAMFDNSSRIEPLDLLLPVGISFYTFQTLSYTIDVYRGIKKPERHLGVFALYVAFFPQLVAGPIERSTRLLPQFWRIHRFDYDKSVYGLRLIAWGLFKKVVIADNLAQIVNQIYGNPTAFDGPYLILATYLFAFQIYCDFSGYSDIAIGTSKIFGFDLMENFRRPYFSTSIAEFWRRWHISLSTWFRDYVYISMGGSKVPQWRWQYNILVVFLISGLWHGASWTFVVWGALHGFYIIAEHLLAPVRERLAIVTGLANYPALRKFVAILVSFNLVAIGWIFFRAQSMNEALYIVTHLFSNFSTGLANLTGLIPVDRELGMNLILRKPIMIGILLICSMETVHAFQEFGKMHVGEWFGKRPTWQRWAVYYGCLAAVLLGAPSGETDFLYFQF